MMLADAAQAVEGKLYILGGGWSVTGPFPVPHAIGLKFEVPWDQANIRQRFQLQLLDGDGQAVQVDTGAGPQPIMIGGEFEVGRPPGTMQGTPLDQVVAYNFPPLQLLPGSRYSWVLYINDETQDEWNLSFTTRPLSPGLVLEQPPG